MTTAAGPEDQEFLLEVLVSQVTEEEANHVLAAVFRGREGYEAGSFIAALIEAILLADPSNKRLLGLGFPGYVAAVQLYQNVRGGTDLLRQIARR